MQNSGWLWLVVALFGAFAALWPRRGASIPERSQTQLFEPLDMAPDSSRAAHSGRSFLASGALWGLVLAVWVGFGLEFWAPELFAAHRLAWWSWTAGLFCGGLVAGAAERGKLEPPRAASLGVAILGALLASFAASDLARGARVEVLLGLGAGWILVRGQGDALPVALAAILASLALLRDARSGGEAWSFAAGVAILVALVWMASHRFASRARLGIGAAGVAVGAGFLATRGQTSVAAVLLAGVFCGALWAWHESENENENGEVAAFSPLVALALALGANTALQGFGVALGALIASATLWALDARQTMPRIAAIGAILAFYRLLEAREVPMRSVPLGDFLALWMVGAVVALVWAIAPRRAEVGWRSLSFLLIWLGLAALLVVWGPRATGALLAGCLVAGAFGGAASARGAALAALGLAAWGALALEFFGGPRTERIAVLLGAAALFAILNTLRPRWQRRRA